MSDLRLLVSGTYPYDLPESLLTGLTEAILAHLKGYGIREAAVSTDADLAAAMRAELAAARERIADLERGAHPRWGIYVVSKVIHARMWRAWRRRASIIATWIDEAGEGQTADHAELAIRCLREATSAERVVLYCQPGEILKGALIEVGAALAAGIPVCCVGTCESLSTKTFSRHPLWRQFESIGDAIFAPLIEAAACSRGTAEGAGR